MTTTSTATSPISGYLADLLERFAAVDDGQVASYIPELADADPTSALLAAYGRYAGRRLEIDDAVYASERDTGHRNRAIAHLLNSFRLLDVSPEAAVDLYFRQCAVSVDCRDLALIAATLANG